jgi:hypothetical protein
MGDNKAYLRSINSEDLRTFCFGKYIETRADSHVERSNSPKFRIQRMQIQKNKDGHYWEQRGHHRRYPQGHLRHCGVVVYLATEMLVAFGQTTKSAFEKMNCVLRYEAREFIDLLTWVYPDQIRRVAVWRERSPPCCTIQDMLLVRYHVVAMQEVLYVAQVKSVRCFYLVEQMQL